MTPHLSVCIVNWNTRDDLRACLHALDVFPFMRGTQEIIVVDNGSGDGSANMVATEYPVALLIANTANESFARGTNQALEAASGDCLLLLNPDARVTQGALDALWIALDPLPEVAAVGAKLIGDDGMTQRSVRGFPAPWPLLWDILGVARLFPNNRNLAAYRMPYFNYDAPGNAPQPMASCFLIARTAYEALGGMDERFPLYWNDVDWCLRAWEAGYRIGYTPDAAAIHSGGGTTRKVRKAAVWESHRALLRLYAKHYKDKTPGLLYAALTALITLGAWARTGRWGESLGRDGGETTPESLSCDLTNAN